MTKTLLIIEGVCVVVMLVGILGQRSQLIPFKAAFGSFALAALVISIVALIALVMLVLSFGPIQMASRPLILIAFAVGVVPLVMIVLLVGKGLQVPKIHDISTNLDDNIVFEKAPALRKAGENSLGLPSEKVIRLHREFYQLQPLVFDDKANNVYRRALEIANELGWDIHYQNDERLVFEATDTTALFGFVDDIGVRIRETEGKSVVDVRSVSRVGVSDLGANAKRVLRFQGMFRDD